MHYTHHSHIGCAEHSSMYLSSKGRRIWATGDIARDYTKPEDGCSVSKRRTRRLTNHLHFEVHLLTALMQLNHLDDRADEPPLGSRTCGSAIFCLRLMSNNVTNPQLIITQK